MPDANTMVMGALVALGVLLVFPYGDALLKLFIIAVATALLLFGVVQGVRRRQRTSATQASQGTKKHAP